MTFEKKIDAEGFGLKGMGSCIKGGEDSCIRMIVETLKRERKIPYRPIYFMTRNLLFQYFTSIDKLNLEHITNLITVISGRIV